MDRIKFMIRPKKGAIPGTVGGRNFLFCIIFLAYFGIFHGQKQGISKELSKTLHSTGIFANKT
jgi:hypothetical protein